MAGGNVHPGRFTAHIDGDFVVFMIGMRINKPWKVHRWMPVAKAMPPMIRSLMTNPAQGMLGVASWFGRTTMMVQYWRSFEDLDRFARNPDEPHLAAWRRFNKVIAASGDVGIWHETYKVGAGAYEAVYGNMPVFGLASAGDHEPIGRRGQSAARRIGAAQTDEVAVEGY